MYNRGRYIVLRGGTVNSSIQYRMCVNAYNFAILFMELSVIKGRSNPCLSFYID